MTRIEASLIIISLFAVGGVMSIITLSYIFSESIKNKVSEAKTVLSFTLLAISGTLIVAGIIARFSLDTIEKITYGVVTTVHLESNTKYTNVSDMTINSNGQDIKISYPDTIDVLPVAGDNVKVIEHKISGYTVTVEDKQ